MQFSKLAFMVTDDCNFRCSYCRQKKEKKYLKHSTIEKAVPFFYPFLSDEAYIIFFGGEPLLAFDIIKYAVSFFQEQEEPGKKKLKFTLTTNGSLLTDEILHFFDLYSFSVMLSFDGAGQDITRKPGTMASTRELIRRLQNQSYPGIEFSTNSVFTPATINYLSESLHYIIESGVTEIEFSLDETESWDEAALLTMEKELERLTDFLVLWYKENRTIPLVRFQRPEGPPKKGFFCGGGVDRVTITPGEYLWGCGHFHPYLKDKEGSDEFTTYSLGKLHDFIENHETLYPRWLENCADLRQDFFFTGKQFCFLCEDVDHCRVCPVYAAYATSFIGKIPPWMCKTARILRKAKETFFKIIDQIDSKKIG